MLFQNYPNPFNNKSKIKYQIPKSTFVTLSVYDVTGREITKLVNEQLNQGYYETTFDGINLPSGVYFYQLRTEEFTDTKKLFY